MITQSRRTVLALMAMVLSAGSLVAFSSSKSTKEFDLLTANESRSVLGSPGHWTILQEPITCPLGGGGCTCGSYPLRAWCARHQADGRIWPYCNATCTPGGTCPTPTTCVTCAVADTMTINQCIVGWFWQDCTVIVGAPVTCGTKVEGTCNTGFTCNPGAPCSTPCMPTGFPADNPPQQCQDVHVGC